MAYPLRRIVVNEKAFVFYFSVLWSVLWLLKHMIIDVISMHPYLW